MNWLKRKSGSEANSYWDTISDVMSTLLLVLMLVMVLLILYVVRAPEYTNPESIPESIVMVEDGVEEQYVERDAGNTVIDVDVPYQLPGSEDEEYGRGELTGDFLNEDGGFGEDEFDGHEGAAVRVIVEDAETHSPITESGISFSLYSAEGRRKTLYTYYPSKTPWLSFSTDESGAFYIPEKLPLAEYVLHEVTAPAGYEASEDLAFTVEEPRTWSEAYVLRVPLNSIRNTVHITAVDSVTGDPVPGCGFDIIAAEDIVTADGTVRYAKDTVVDQVLCDEEGQGRSVSLYLGNYLIQPSSAPEYYAVGKKSYPVTLEGGEDDAGIFEQEIPCEKTRFTLNVVDELYSTQPVSGAEFEFQSEHDASPVTLTADENGTLTIESLQKSTAYTLLQSGTAEGYQVNGKNLSFFVDSNGRIDNEAAAEQTLTNRTLRLSVLVEDAIFHNAVPGCRVQLYDEASRLTDAWDSSDTATTVQGMDPGTYRLEISGAASGKETVLLPDTAEVQQLTCSVWTTGNKLAVGGSAAGVGGIGTAAGLLLRRSGTKKKKAGKA